MVYKYREVRGTFTALTPDTTDADEHPNIVPLEGAVVLTPRFSNGGISFAELGHFDQPQVKRAAIENGELKAVVVDEETGHLTRQALFLPVTDDDRADQQWSYEASFQEVVRSDTGERVVIPPRRFVVEAGADPLNLVAVATTQKAGAIVTRGPRGYGVAEISAANGELVFAWEDGTEHSVPVPEAVQGVGVEGVAQPDAESMSLLLTDGTTTSPITLPAGAPGKDGANVLPTEEAIAQSDSLTMTLAGQTAMAEATQARTNDLHAQIRLTPDGRYRTTLWSGQEGPTYAVNNGGSAAPDSVRVIEGQTSQRVSVQAGQTAAAIIYPTPVEFGPASIVRALVWVDDPSRITSLSLQVRLQNSPSVVNWTRTAETLTPGWNLLSWKAAASTTVPWGECHRVQFIIIASEPTAVSIQSAWTETTPKAQILFIEDRGYRTFVEQALPDLRARNIPVTWALDPMLNGSNVGTPAEAITDQQVAEFYTAGDDMSIHAYAGEVTATMTAEQIRRDTLLSHRWLQERGYTRGSGWRAAWTQNSAQNHRAAQPYYAAYATPNSAAGMETWPFTNPYEVGRVALHSVTPEQMDGLFATLERTRSLFVCYTHGVHPDLGGAITPDGWAHFISKIDEGIAGGWLEGVTYSQLLARSAGLLR